MSRCAIDEPRLAELSGMAVTEGQLWAASDGGRRVDLHRLDDGCAVADTRTARIDPYDAEDLALGPGGAFWVGDIGDNERRRATVAVIVVPPRGEPRLHRLTYPDGPHDAEALLVDPAGRPLIVTKELGRPAGVYRTDAPPAGEEPTPLVAAGTVALPPSSTQGGPIGGLGTRTVTGAAMSADGAVVALRTYTDAWLFPVRDGDVAAALTGAPVQVPLPGEPQGEAIAFEADGTLLSGSETRGGVSGEIRAVAGVAALVAGPAAGPGSSGSQPSGSQPSGSQPSGSQPAGPSARPGDVVAAEPEAPPEWLPGALGAGGVAVLLALLVLAMRLRRRR